MSVVLSQEQMMMVREAAGGSDDPLATFERVVQESRPELHRYSARMIGSVIDAEDVVQDALARASASLGTTSVGNMRAWLFRITHNAAIDYLRRRSKQSLVALDENMPRVEPDSPLDEQELVAIALSVFLHLTPKQRSCVILKDVLGYSLADISELLDATVGEIKAALHRGRTRLRTLSASVTTDSALSLHEQERELLARYVEHFNARDFDAVRRMLADEVRLDLVARLTLHGRADVSEYFHRYEQRSDWRLAVGTFEQRPAILMYDTPDEGAPPAYVVLLQWANGSISTIRDYRYARYAMQDAVYME